MMDREKLAALAADTCWLCGQKKKDLHQTVLLNAGGRYDLRYDYLCTFCFMFMQGAGAN